MDGAHTHDRGPTGLGELVAIAAGVALAAMVVAGMLTFLLIGLAIAGGVLLIGFVGYVVAACRHYQEATALDAARAWPVVPEEPLRAVNADPVPLRQAITEMHAQLLADRSGLPAADWSQHQHLHFHGMTPEQVAAIIAKLKPSGTLAGWEDGGSQ